MQVAKGIRKVWLGLAAAVAVSSVLGAYAFADYTTGWYPWHMYTQGSRNAQILNKAYGYLGQNLGLNCKDFARRVVKEASNYHVTLPPTLPDDSGWYWNYDVNLVGMSGGIYSVQPGWLVQMNWRKDDGTITPHTAIVYAVTGTGVYFIESNWCSNNCKTVSSQPRFVSFSDFLNRVGTKYSVYYIL